MNSLYKRVLPIEIKEQIFSYCNSKEILNISLTCTENYEIVQTNYFFEKWMKNVIKTYTSKNGVFFDKIDDLFLDCVKNNNLKMVKYLITLPGVDASAGLKGAIFRGHLEIVKYLSGLEGVDVSADDNYAIRYASIHGQLEVVKYLSGLEGVDPSVDDNAAIRWASERGHLEVVKFLITLPGVYPFAYGDYAIRYASKNGHLEVVKYLSGL